MFQQATQRLLGATLLALVLWSCQTAAAVDWQVRGQCLPERIPNPSQAPFGNVSSTDLCGSQLQHVCPNSSTAAGVCRQAPAGKSHAESCALTSFANVCLSAPDSGGRGGLPTTVALATRGE